MSTDSNSIGPYQIVGQLGEGGMGVVYRGRDPHTGDFVAVKTARPDHSHAFSSLRSEIAALARLEHPGVVRILHHGDDEGVPWYAMELLDGETWEDYNKSLWTRSYDGGLDDTHLRDSADEADFDLTARARPPVDGVPNVTRPQAAQGRLEEVLTLARRLCTSLAVLHGYGFVHRDLKPSNVFLVESRPIVTDLGIATRYRGAVGREKIEAAGKLVGTMRYIAPEQARGQLVDARADLYAFGTMLYETVTGRLPFSADSVSEWLHRVLEESPIPPSQLVDGIPAELEQLMFSLLAKRPRDRIGHADDVARVLESLGAKPDDIAGIEAPAYLYRPEMGGREEALLELERAIVQAAKGKGSLAAIGGESGVGKTLLASEAARAATTRSLNVIIGECLPLSVGGQTRVDLQGAPLHPIRPLLHAAGDLALTRGSETAERLFPEWRARLLANYEPVLATIPGASTQSVPNLPGELARQRLMDAITDTIRAMIEEQGPLILLLDDLQWADDLTLALLTHLLSDELSSLQLLIIGTYRSDEVTPGLVPILEHDGVKTILLDRLGEEAVGGMVKDMLAIQDPPAGFVKFLAAQSEGNPFFVAEYLRLAASEHILRREKGRWTFATKEDTPEAYKKLSLPASLKDLVMRRLAGLSEPARRVLEAASVLGRELERPLLEIVAEEDKQSIDSAIKELVIRQILDVDDLTFRFVHDKLRENTYAGIDEERRVKLNRAAAVALEARAASDDAGVDHAALANFWSEARAWKKAIDALERSAEEALRDFSNEQAIRAFESMEEISKREGIDVGPMRRGRWERGLADAYFDLGRDFEGRAHVSNALELFGQPAMPKSTGAQAFAMFVEIARYMAQVVLEPLFRVGQGMKRTRVIESAYMYNRMIEPTLRNNEPLLGVFCNFRNVNLARRVPATPALGRGYAMLAYVVGITPLQGVARRWAQRAIDMAEKQDDATLCYVLARLCAYYVTVGDWQTSDDVALRALNIARDNRDLRLISEVRLTHSIGLAVEGRFDEQVEAQLEGYEKAAGRGDQQVAGWARCGLAEAYARTGRDPEARALLPWLAEYAGGEREQAEAVWAHASSALVSLQTGDPDQARTDADRAIALMRESPPVPFWLTPGLWSLAEVYLALAESHSDAADVQSKALLAQLAEMVKILSKYAQMIRVARPFARLAEGGLAWRRDKASLAFRRWREALELSQQMGAKFPEGLAHYDLGRHLEGTERETHLNEAAEIFERLGARTELLKTRAAIDSGKIAL